MQLVATEVVDDFGLGAVLKPVISYSGKTSSTSSPPVRPVVAVHSRAEAGDFTPIVDSQSGALALLTGRSG